MGRQVMTRAFAVILFLVGVPAAYGQGAVPVDSEIQVNSYTAGHQYFPSVATLPDGGFVATWFSEGSSGSDSSGTSIQARLYAADGSPLRDEFQVNQTTDGDQQGPVVAAQADGSFMVVWFEDKAVRGRPYAADGSPLAEEFRIASSHPDAYFEFSEVSVAAQGDGNFVVAFIDDAFPDEAVVATRYASDGSFVGGAVVDYDVADLAVAGLVDDEFIVTWNGGLIDYDIIWGQRYSGDLPVGDRIQVSSSDPDQRGAHSMAVDSSGGFVVAWSEEVFDGSDAFETSIQARRFAADGTPVGLQFQVSTSTANRQAPPIVVSEDHGGFVIAWQSEGSTGSDSDGSSIQGQRYAADGLPIGGEFQLNSRIAGDQQYPSLATLESGGFWAAWQSDSSGGSDTFQTSIQARRFAPPRYSLIGLAGKCLDVEDADPADGTPVNLYRCHGGENQTWRLELTDFPQRIVGIGGKCLVPGPVVGSGANRLVIGECDGSGRLWQLTNADHAAPSTLVHLETDLCLDVIDNDTADGSATILFPCHGRPNQLWRPAAEVCTRDSLGFCLNGSRFRVDVDWRDPAGNVGSGRAVPVGSDDSGLLWFFSQDNWEMLIKVLDGCSLNDRFWVFSAATTDVEYTLRVTDTDAGVIQEYFNPLGTASPAITDTSAFATCSAGSSAGEKRVDPVVNLERSVFGLVEAEADPGESKGLCVPSSVDLCLNDNRFRVEVEWRDPAGNRGSARVVPVDSRDSGLLWFFSDNNWEMLVKVLDGCALNDRFWVFSAATTDVEYTLRVTDTENDEVQEYFNPLGTASPAITDTGAFATCP